jgi:2-oxoglutarate ferredoxin oxidoreductase subunit delta
MAKGRILVDVERCKGCELCRSACPPGVIEFSDSRNSKGYRPAMLVESSGSCTGCALCAVICPEACITVFRMVPSRTAVSVVA